MKLNIFNLKIKLCCHKFGGLCISYLLVEIIQVYRLLSAIHLSLTDDICDIGRIIPQNIAYAL